MLRRSRAPCNLISQAAPVRSPPVNAPCRYAPRGGSVRGAAAVRFAPGGSARAAARAPQYANFAWIAARALVIRRPRASGHACRVSWPCEICMNVRADERLARRRDDRQQRRTCYLSFMPRDTSEPADLARIIAATVRATRLECGWTQSELARRVRTNQPEISRLELGRATHLDVGLASRTLHILGVRIRLDAATLGLAGRREQGDLVHAACSNYTVTRLRRAGWDARPEVEIGSGRYRGWIDVLAYRLSDRAMLVVEVKTEIRDVGAIQRTIAWYEREAWSVARSLGWRPTSSSLALLILESIDNDVRASAYRGALHEKFPATGGGLLEWLTDPGPRRIRGAVGMIDPRSRRGRWIAALRSDGRRTTARYRDYADAADRLSSSGRSRRP